MKCCTVHKCGLLSEIAVWPAGPFNTSRLHTEACHLPAQSATGKVKTSMVSSRTFAREVSLGSDVVGFCRSLFHEIASHDLGKL